MSVKRTPQPLQNDQVEFQGDELEALGEILKSSTPRARLKRLEKTMPERARTLEARLTDATASADLLDDISAAEAEALQTQAIKAIAKEHNRRVNLPTAEERHAIWREVAEQVRQETGLKSKSAVAAAVYKRLLESDRKDYLKAVRSPDMISRKI